MRYKDFILEYNDSGKLSYIVDIVTAKGYKINGSVLEAEIDKLLDGLRDSRKTNISSIPRWLRFINFRLQNYSSKPIARLLIFIYASFVLLNIFSVFIKPIKLFPINYTFFSHFSSLQVVVGICIFITGLIVIHEGGHILVSILQGIPVSKLGFRMKYGIVPMVYVRLYPTMYRNKQINIAFAGLVADQILFFAYLLGWDLSHLKSFQVSLLLQVVLTIFNYNLLFPSDLTQMLLSKLDYLDFRKDSFIYLQDIIKNRESIILKKINILKIVYALLFYVLIILMVVNIVSIFFFLIGE